VSARSEQRGALRLAGVIAVAGALSVFAAACAKNRETSAPESAPVRDDIGAIEAELSSNAAALQSEGIALADGKVAEPTSTDESMAGAAQDDADVVQRDMTKERVSAQSQARTKRAERARPRCERICDLAGSTCDLRLRICDLAQVHEGDLRYENACERATTQCEAARAACTRCC
jgi:hypothetical protein